MSNDDDFGAILAAFEREGQAPSERDPKPGESIEGTVLSIGSDTVFVDVGARSDAIVDRAELTSADGALEVAVGDSVRGVIAGHDDDGGFLRLRVRAGVGGNHAASLAMDEIAHAQEHGIPVEGTVREVVKGGVRVTVSGLTGFCPISQLDLGYVEDPEIWVERKERFLVQRFRRGQGGRPADIVLSRRALLEAERQQKRAEALAALEVGQVVSGTVTSVARYGAFVDLGGIEGLVHVSELDHDRVEEVGDVVAEGDRLEVEILGIQRRDNDEVRISLSRRAVMRDPWTDAAERFPAESVVRGRIVRLEAYGAFVRLAPGLEALAHISELAGDRRIQHPREVLTLGQDVEVRILRVDVDARRIGVAIAGRGDEVGREDVEAWNEDSQGSEGFGAMADFFAKAREPKGE